MKVLMVYPTFRRGRYVLPLGMASVAAVLKKGGHKVQVIDADAYNFTDSQLCDLIKKLDYDVVATGGLATCYEFVRDLTAMVKKIRPNTIVIAGGHFINTTPEIVMNSTDIDIGVMGEGEYTALELINTLERGGSLREVKGLIFKENGILVRTEPRDVIKDLDELPFPDRDLFRAGEIYSRYSFSSSIFGARRSLNISIGRGCPYQCTFCSYDRRVRLRSVDNVLQELSELRKKYRIQAFDIQDELFIINRKRAIEFCEKLIRKKWNMKWMAAGRVNLVDKELLRLLRKAGCVFLGFGIESGDVGVLERMKKGITPDQVINALRLTREAGIEPGGSFILGMPGENRRTVKNTVSLYKEINKYRSYTCEFFFATPYPGTELYDEMRSLGRITDEVGFLKKLSVAGDAFNFVVNCTEELNDKELCSLKKEIEKEVHDDFFKKHPALVIFRKLLNLTGWLKFERILVKIKLNGVRWLFRTALRKVQLLPNESDIVVRELFAENNENRKYKNKRNSMVEEEKCQKTQQQ